MDKKHPLAGRRQTEEHKKKRLQSLLRNGKLKGRPSWNKGVIGQSIKDITGQRFGRLVVLEYAGIYRSPNGGGRGALWKCQCDCEVIKTIQRGALINGSVVSCGCFNRENARKLGLSNVGKNNGMFGQIEHFRKIGLKSLLKQAQYKQPTSIEKIVYDFLSKNGIDFEKQKLIKGKFLVDAYIPATNTIVECDGAYWHSLPKNQKRDKAKNAYLTKCGFNLIRLPEAIIRNNSFQHGLIAV